MTNRAILLARTQVRTQNCAVCAHWSPFCVAELKYEFLVWVWLALRATFVLILTSYTPEWALLNQVLRSFLKLRLVYGYKAKLQAKRLTHWERDGFIDRPSPKIWRRRRMSNFPREIPPRDLGQKPLHLAQMKPVSQGSAVDGCTLVRGYLELPGRTTAML